MASLLAVVLRLYVYALFGRIILSWFPIRPGSPWVGIYSLLYSITEPVLGPIRRVLPSFGGLDFSPMIVIFGLSILGPALLGRSVVL